MNILPSLLVFLWLVLAGFATIGVLVVGFAILCVRDSKKMRRGQK